MNKAVPFVVVALLAVPVTQGAETTSWFDVGLGEGEHDAYHFTIETNAEVTVQATDWLEKCSLDPRLTLMGSDEGYPIEHSQSSAGECPSLRAFLPEGSFQIRVEGRGGAAVPPYLLRLEVEPVAAAEVSYTSSVVQSMDAIHILDIFPMAGFAAGEHDTFSFAADEDELLTARTAAGASGCSGDTRIELYGVNAGGGRERLAGDDDGGQGPCSALELPIGAGDYELEVHGAGGDPIPAYTLTLDRQAALSERRHPAAGPEPEAVDLAQARIDESIAAADEARYQGMVAEAEAARARGSMDLAARVWPGFDRLAELDAIRDVATSLAEISDPGEFQRRQHDWLSQNRQLVSDAFAGPSTATFEVTPTPPLDAVPESVCCVLEGGQPGWSPPGSCEERLPPPACMPVKPCCCLPDDGPGALGTWSTRADCGLPFCLNAVSSDRIPNGCETIWSPPRAARRATPSSPNRLAPKRRHQLLTRYRDVELEAPYDPRMGRRGETKRGCTPSGRPSQDSKTGRVSVSSGACAGFPVPGYESQWAEVGHVVIAQPAAQHMQITAEIELDTWSCSAFTFLGTGGAGSAAGLTVRAEDLNNLGTGTEKKIDVCSARAHPFWWSSNTRGSKRTFKVQTVKFKVINGLWYTVRAGAHSWALAIPVQGIANGNAGGRVRRITVKQW